MNGINFGGFLFTNPVPLAFALLPRDPGLFAIQVRNMGFSPMPFEPIHFGASALLSEERLAEHDDQHRWQRHRLAWGGLFVSSFPLRYEGPAYRELAVAQLAHQYLRFEQQGVQRERQRHVAVTAASAETHDRQGPDA